VNKTTLKVHQDQLQELILRDKNHPSVVMISVGNEANTQEGGAYEYWKALIDFTRKLTKLPITLIEWVSAEMNQVATLVDVIGVNRYVGWYTDFADLSVIKKQLPKILKDYHDKFQKPILLSEFGADTIAGFHALPSVAFSEEFQVKFIDEYRKAIAELDFVIGEHLWNFADFMTKQGLNRFGGNKKGVFTRDRQPKMIAHYLKKVWSEAR
jgi:beta-glucuronidase